MGRYRKIDMRIQNDAKFRSLSERAKLVFFLTLSHPNMTMIGAMRATIPGLSAEWSMPEESLREAFQEVFSKGMVKADESACFVWLPNFLKYNRPESPNVVKSWPEAFDLLPECSMKGELFQSLKQFAVGLSEGFTKAFMEAFAKTMPNQEQEQEQEQDKTPRAAPKEFPSQKPEFNPVEVAIVICRELGFAGRDIRLLIEEQITNEMHRLPGTNAQQVGQTMDDQWRLYQRSAEWKTQFKKSPKSFFSSPAWKDSPDQWERSSGKPAVSAQADRHERNRKNILAGIGLEDSDHVDDRSGHVVEGDQPGGNEVVDRVVIPLPRRRD
jgi:hypothetical protein